jgi:hypothetical protein
LLLLGSAILAYADPQSSQVQVPVGPAVQPPTIGREPSDQVLELPPLVGAELSPAPSALASPKIPPGFLGCWEGRADGFDYISTSNTIGGPGKIVFCYRPTRIDVPEVDIQFSRADWIKNVAMHMGLGLTLVSVDTPAISTTIYRITPTQIYARTFVPTKIKELLLWVLPVSTTEMLVDEEVATLTGPNSIFVQAHQALDAGGTHSARTWHATFHRYESR